MSVKKHLNDTAAALQARHKAHAAAIILVKSSRTVEVSFVARPKGPTLPAVLEMVAEHLRCGEKPSAKEEWSSIRKLAAHKLGQRKGRAL